MPFTCSRTRIKWVFKASPWTCRDERTKSRDFGFETLADRLQETLLNFFYSSALMKTICKRKDLHFGIGLEFHAPSHSDKAVPTQSSVLEWSSCLEQEWI
ncbi:MAG: hypothetical protein KME08_18790 [Aphanothece sp. CMT-3BRIN-NPC111]|nr:hypothetical protein [Aphanothece sp. CMT-3BRIN-NPC111]